MIRFAVCDDNPAYLEYLRGVIQECAGSDLPEPEVMVFPSAQSLLFAMEDIKDLADTFFLNVRLSDADGIVLAEKLRRLGHKGDIVFLTESGQDALRAFDVGALNYIDKNEACRERTYRVIRQAVDSAKKKHSARLVLRSGGETRSIPIREVRYLEVKDHLIVVHYAAQTFSFLSTIGKLEKRMEPYGFVRCHRSVLVSVHHIQSVTRGKAVLDSGETVPVSRNRLPVLLSRMDSAGKGCHTEEQSKWTGESFTQKDSLS